MWPTHNPLTNNVDTRDPTGSKNVKKYCCVYLINYSEFKMNGVKTRWLRFQQIMLQGNLRLSRPVLSCYTVAAGDLGWSHWLLTPGVFLPRVPLVFQWPLSSVYLGTGLWPRPSTAQLTHRTLPPLLSLITRVWTIFRQVTYYIASISTIKRSGQHARN